MVGQSKVAVAVTQSKSEKNNAPDSSPILAVNALSFSIGGRQIISDLSLGIESGMIACVVGPSGSGKTTLLRLLAGLERPTFGEVVLDGKRQTGPHPETGVVFQDYGRALLPWRTVAGNVSLALEALGVEKRFRAARINELLNIMGLQQHAAKYPGQLSGGMQQRLQIARTLAQEPKVLLMDEPFGALDAQTRQTLQDELLRLAATKNMTILFVTHDLEEAIYLGDQVIALSSSPASIQEVVPVPLSRPRHQLSTREHPDFALLRRKLATRLEERPEAS